MDKNNGERVSQFYCKLCKLSLRIANQIYWFAQSYVNEPVTVKINRDIFIYR